MTYKTILVSLPNAENAERLIQHACTVARRFDTHLIGLHTVPAVEVYADIMNHMTAEMADAMDKARMAEANKIEAAFKRITKTEDFVSEWRCASSYQPTLSERIIEHARCVDMVILGQPDEKTDRTDQKQIYREIIEGVGRPVLVIPHTGNFDQIGDQILIGWSPTRESTRAAHDAIPFAKTAKKTTIFWVTKSGGSDLISETGKEMAICLDRHGAKAGVSHRVQLDLSIGDEILNEAADSGADLIVTGAYGHSRIYDFMIGATTPHLMKHMTVPILFSC